MVTASGKFLTVKQAPSTTLIDMGSLHSLPVEKQKSLALDRYRLEPDFKLGIFGMGIMSKADVIRNIKDETPFGKLAVQVEMQYCNELMQAIKATKLPVISKMPIPLDAANGRNSVNEYGGEMRNRLTLSFVDSYSSFMRADQAARTQTYDPAQHYT